MVAPIRLGHVGLCVTDIDAAIRWYCDTLDLELLDGPRDLRADGGPFAEVLRDVFGESFRHARFAQLSFAGDVGLELFQFVEPKTRPVSASYFATGFSHICFTAEDLEQTVERIRDAGGRIRTRIWHESPDRPYRLVHFEDPYGNLLELHSHGNRETVTGLRDR